MILHSIPSKYQNTQKIRNHLYHSVIHTKLKGISMSRPLGFYLSLDIGHNFPRKM